MSQELKGYITVQEAALKIKRSTEQVRRYLREGKLEGQRIGGQWFIRESAVAYMVREGSALGGPSPAPEEEEAMMPATSANKKMLFDRMSARSAAIRQRWEKRGVTIDIAAIVREVREEAR